MLTLSSQSHCEDHAQVFRIEALIYRIFNAPPYYLVRDESG